MFKTYLVGIATFTAGCFTAGVVALGRLCFSAGAVAGQKMALQAQNAALLATVQQQAAQLAAQQAVQLAAQQAAQQVAQLGPLVLEASKGVLNVVRRLH